MGWVVNATPLPLYPRERPGTHCIRGGVGPRAGLSGRGKSRPPTGFKTKTSEEVKSLCLRDTSRCRGYVASCTFVPNVIQQRAL
jgi:hypothetical protein